jgi:hypothetical protein
VREGLLTVVRFPTALLIVGYAAPLILLMRRRRSLSVDASMFLEIGFSCSLVDCPVTLGSVPVSNAFLQGSLGLESLELIVKTLTIRLSN